MPPDEASRVIRWRRKRTAREEELKILGHDPHGYAVTRVQFNRHGGFRLTTIQNGKKQVMFVPNDLRNVQAQWVRQWLIEGNFPEDDDPPPNPPRVLGISMGVWKSIGALVIVTCAALGGAATLLALAPRILGH